MTDVVVEKQGHVAVVKIEHMKAMNALSTDMYALQASGNRGNQRLLPGRRLRAGNVL